MIITLSIQLASGMYAEADWGCELEIEENSTLHDLHDAIQQAVDFDNDHLYSFFISRREFGSERIHFDGEEFSLDDRITSLFPLPKGKKLFYWFDFGDDWIFQVSKSRKKPREPQPDRHYPFVTAETGTRPEQYKDYDPEAEDEW
ncbi:IS1096 element passenger TnpR family protein [Oceanisphaera sp.]|uniref:IS1096 element passenger TnpR family protein n=1 Tax=Oceanisphaera sp. TaxID=1929979 RepID=UPI003A947F84